jgi:hypothetical protein
MPDWLGYEEKECALSFEAARIFVRTLKLGTRKEWVEYSKSGRRPPNIPSNPDQAYRKEGWVSMPDWLGTKKGKKGTKERLSFEAARTFVRTLKLGSAKEWGEYSKSGKRPSNIPSAPDKTYRDDGWLSMPDWLGYGIGKKKQNRKKNQTAEEKAAKIARKAAKKKRKQQKRLERLAAAKERGRRRSTGDRSMGAKPRRQAPKGAAEEDFRNAAILNGRFDHPISCIEHVYVCWVVVGLLLLFYLALPLDHFISPASLFLSLLFLP